ncbi:MAG TPA: O-methyltransferase [Opitutus sp.]|nr:O-methyltransferase [Opitutus sp.]
MNAATWTAVDSYLNGLLVPRDDALDAALAASAEAGLPAIAVSPLQGRMLQLFARMMAARAILEIGTLGGYSTICLARALPADGKVVTLELEPRHAEVARRNFARAGLAEKIEVRVGRALGSLTMLAAEKAGPFDLIFIDADKAGIPEYFDWSLKLARPGTAIVVDNVVRKGEVADAASTDVAVRGVRRFNEMLAKERRVTATTIQTVGSKGYDGFTLAIVDAVA